MAGRDLTWDDTERVGIALCKRYPEIEPGGLGLRDVQRYATSLGDFKGDPASYDEGKLEAIRSAWTTEFLDRTQ